MSGSGGFYKYRCKNFYAHSCPRWVYVNGEACPECLAAGYDNQEREIPRWLGAHDVCVPVVHDGILQYTLMELFSPDASGNYWTLRAKVTGAPPAASISATAELPRPAVVGGGGPGVMAVRY